MQPFVERAKNLYVGHSKLLETFADYHNRCRVALSVRITCSLIHHVYADARRALHVHARDSSHRDNAHLRVNALHDPFDHAHDHGHRTGGHVLHAYDLPCRCNVSGLQQN